LKPRGVKLPIVSWAATIGATHQESLTDVNIRMIRPGIDMSVLGETQSGGGLKVCQALFTATFTLRGSTPEIALLANNNPVYHMPVTLLNLPRVERDESWVTYEQTTGAVSRLCEALDAERIAVGVAYGFSMPKVNEHFHQSFDVAPDAMDVMMAALFRRGLRPKGAGDTGPPHFSQDIPWGLVFTSQAGRYCGHRDAGP
jgi:opine dehydrogenase